MKYAYLGSSGLVVSKLAFGAMTFAAEGAPPFARVGEQDAARLVDQALAAGVNFFDTADVYSNMHNEEILGRVLGAQRKDVVLSTKVGSRAGAHITERGLNARHVHLSFEGSLKRLGTDWIDLYLCHLPDAVTPLEETLLALDQIVRAGKVRYIGFSNWPAWIAAKAVQMQKDNGWARFVAGQYHYNLLGRDIEYEIVPAAIDAGVGLMCYSPLASGKLSGKYSKENPTGDNGRLSQISLLTQQDDQKAERVIEVARDIASQHDVPVSAVALAWVTEQAAVSTVILGANNSNQLEQNLSATTFDLSAVEIAALSESSRPADMYPFAMIKALGDGSSTDPRERMKTPTLPKSGRWAPKAAS